LLEILLENIMTKIKALQMQGFSWLVLPKKMQAHFLKKRLEIRLFQSFL